MEYMLAFQIIILRCVDLSRRTEQYHKNRFLAHESQSDIHILIIAISMQPSTPNRALSAVLVLLFTYLCGVSLQTNQACQSQYEMCNAHEQRLTRLTCIW
jgi:hypothetical protein